MKGTFVMAGGGTGGHVMPGLAVAKELRGRGYEAVFVGTSRGLEARLAPEAGFPLRLLRIGALKRVSWRERMRTLAALPASLLEAGRVLDDSAPAAVLSLGGYASGPVTCMAVMKNIPVVVMEPNAMPGFAHRMIGPFARRALLGFEQAAPYFPPQRWEVTGVPVRPEFFTVPRKSHRPPYTVLITGGSQGSHRLNMTALECFKLWNSGEVSVLHQTGEMDYDEVCSRYREIGAAAETTPFLRDMPAALARADVVVCRSGASTLAELCAAARASILVPFPYAADQHQLRNAEALAAAGGARVIEDRELTGERLCRELRALLETPGRLEAMEQAARRLAHPDAARRAADVLEAVGSGRQDVL
jgi:UDP-N-acetylglucosamine--N-acetylmuramyl-(pentapeptide) pyrophosphoryl-undecaprenol N-acetylglucosamine transferase